MLNRTDQGIKLTQRQNYIGDVCDAFVIQQLVHPVAEQRAVYRWNLSVGDDDSTALPDRQAVSRPRAATNRFSVSRQLSHCADDFTDNLIGITAATDCQEL